MLFFLAPRNKWLKYFSPLNAWSAACNALSLKCIPVKNRGASKVLRTKYENLLF